MAVLVLVDNDSFNPSCFNSFIIIRAPAPFSSAAATVVSESDGSFLLGHAYGIVKEQNDNNLNLRYQVLLEENNIIRPVPV